jgi:hypothetical protein
MGFAGAGSTVKTNMPQIVRKNVADTNTYQPGIINIWAKLRVLKTDSSGVTQWHAGALKIVKQKQREI